MYWLKRNASMNEMYGKSWDKGWISIANQWSRLQQRTDLTERQCWKKCSAWFGAHLVLTAPMDAIIYIRNHFVSLQESLCGRGNTFFLLFFLPLGDTESDAQLSGRFSLMSFFLSTTFQSVTQVSLECRCFSMRSDGKGIECQIHQNPEWLILGKLQIFWVCLKHSFLFCTPSLGV